ncbi:hypothetical protein EV177_000730 [Coemansia sp. RSA 1804]|nr:hypothetical protein EV177_000730 [Coemansia sp. RSA 1804]
MVWMTRKGQRRAAALILALLCSTQLLAAAQPTIAGVSKRHGGDEHDERDEEMECGAEGVDDWNKGLHIGGIFVIMATGGLGAYLPVVGRFVPALRIPQTALTLGKFLGTGVIIATALIHMLPAASESLGNPCIGSRMGNYSGWPGAIAMMAIFGMHALEFLLSNHAMSLHTHAHGSSHTATSHGHHHDSSHGPHIDPCATPAASSDAGDNRKVSLESATPPGRPAAIAVAGGSADAQNCDAVAVHTHHTHVHGKSLLDRSAEDSHKQRISTYILELGICMHSVLIGLDLSVTTGSGFKTLLVAICFHQFCEGLALGSRLASPIRNLTKSHARAFLGAAVSAAVFMLITPLGMVIGIGVRYSYQPNSPSSLMAMGVLDSLAAGILLYSGLVNLLAEEFGTLEFRGYRVRKKVACFLFCFVGAGVMALIGKWA